MQLGTPRSSHRNGSAGFSVTEMLVATALGLLLIGAFMSFNRAQLFALQDQARQIDIQTTARNLVELFAREVRRAGTNPTCAKGIEAIATAKSYELRIQSDLDGDGTAVGANEDVTYKYDFAHRTIRRVAGDAPDLLLAGMDLRDSAIRYFDGAGVELVPGPELDAAQRAAVRRVRIELAIAGAAANPNNKDLLVARTATDVNLRNRFFIHSITCP